MKLFYCEVPFGNFGDDLNLYLWPKLLPGAFEGTVRFWPAEPKVVDRDNPSDTLFAGIGTLLLDKVPFSSRKIVFGSGAGKSAHPVLDEKWEFYCVRGPLTARALGLPEQTAIADPAILVRLLAPPARRKRFKTAFMPHWCQAQSGAWQKICAATGIHFIDPRWPPAQVLQAIAESECMISEALHGAIVADALRVPWVAVSSKHHIQDFKWQDWCQSVGLSYAPVTIPAIWTPRPGLPGKAITAAKMLQGGTVLSRLQPRANLSSDSTVSRLTDRLVERLQTLASDKGLKLDLAPALSH